MSKRKAAKIISAAVREGRTALSEYEAKLVLGAYGIPVTKEILAENKKELNAAIKKIGFPLVMKGCSSEIAHKTEKGLIFVDVRNSREALAAFDQIKAGMKGYTGAVLVQEMIKGRRELVMGLTRDPQFGPCVMFGLGGIFTEILHDVSFRRAPLETEDALEMMREIKANKILDAVRGLKAANTKKLSSMLINVGQIGLDFEEVAEIDLNPVIISGTQPVVVDALIILKPKAGET